jgi:lipid II:glycine glycyltransferase (peptidoglycan interpeptide bridge formation enzyme)
VRLGEFEGKTLKRAYQMTLHKVPYLRQTIGYLPKGPMPSTIMVNGLSTIARERNVAFIKLEPDVEKRQRDPSIALRASKETESQRFDKLGLVKAKKALFTKYNFVLDLTKSEEELMAAMHPKTRYNIKVAQKKGVEVYESTTEKDFETYVRLYFETTRRQKYFGHTPQYHRLAWETLKPAGMARVMIAKYQKKPLVAWMLLIFGDTLYYPYGGSSEAHREVMASNLIAWEAIRLGKKLKLKTFDMWGALGPEANANDPWYGFHRFKAGYSPALVEYVGTYDLVLNRPMYEIINLADRLRWLVLRASKR